MEYKTGIEQSNYFKKVIRLTLLLASICLLIVSCGTVTDVSNDVLLWGGYNPNKKYKLNIDVFLNNDHEVSPEKKSKYWKGADVPDSIEEYLKAQWSLKYWSVKGIIAKGTMIRPEVLERHIGTSPAGTVGKYDNLYPYARILTGSFKGMLVNIFWISDYCNKDERPYPYTEILTEINDIP